MCLWWNLGYHLCSLRRSIIVFVQTKDVSWVLWAFDCGPALYLSCCQVAYSWCLQLAGFPDTLSTKDVVQCIQYSVVKSSVSSTACNSHI